MTYSTRLQILQEEQAAKNAATIANMAEVTKEMKLKGDFPAVADAMTTFLRSCLPTAGTHPSRTLSA